MLLSAQAITEALAPIQHDSALHPIDLRHITLRPVSAMRSRSLPENRCGRKGAENFPAVTTTTMAGNSEPSGFPL